MINKNISSIQLILVLFFLFGACRVNRISRIDNYFVNKYPEIKSYTTNNLIEKNRKKLILNFFNFYKENSEINDIKLIELHRFPNGNFDEAWSYIYIFLNNKLKEAYFVKSDSDIINKINIQEDPYLETVNTIVDLYNGNRFEKLMNLHKKNIVSDSGLFYLTDLNIDFKILNGIMFREFMVN